MSILNMALLSRILTVAHVFPMLMVVLLMSYGGCIAKPRQPVSDAKLKSFELNV